MAKAVSVSDIALAASMGKHIADRANAGSISKLVKTRGFPKLINSLTESREIIEFGRLKIKTWRHVFERLSKVFFLATLESESAITDAVRPTEPQTSPFGVTK